MEVCKVRGLRVTFRSWLLNAWFGYNMLYCLNNFPLLSVGWSGVVVVESEIKFGGKLDK